MGYRLEGPALTQRGKTELISEGLTFGAIQVPSHGQPMVIMAWKKAIHFSIEVARLS